MILLKDINRSGDSELIHADGSIPFAADQSMGSNRLTNVADPSSAQDAATKNYVDGLVRGLDWKASCRVATTANITLSGTQTIDGVSVLASERVLVKNQSTGSQNGIYVCDASTWSRAVDADASAEVTSGMSVTVTEGSTNGNKTFVLTTDDPITLGSTSLTFSQLGDGNSGGDVVGPGSSTDNGIPRFDGTGGKTLQTATGATIDDDGVVQFRSSRGTGVALSDGATITWDWRDGSFASVTLGGNRTLAFSNVATDKAVFLRLKQDGTGSRTVTWPAGVVWPSGAAPTLTTTAGRTDVFGFYCATAGGSPAFIGFVLGQNVNL